MRTLIKKHLLVFISLCALQVCNSTIKAQYFPDEEILDTTGLVQETLIDGIDTVWYIGVEEIQEAGEGFKLGLINDSVITINLGNQKKPVAKNLFGFATAEIFSRLQMPIPVGTDTFSRDQWNWMSELSPEVLRFPGGAESKFMDVLKGPGYGYDLAKLIRYYDITDNVLNYPTIADVLDDGKILDSLDNWITPTEGFKYVFQFLEFKNKWDAQQYLDTSHRYIDDFIELIKKIETDDTSNHVKVVYCLDIFSNSATQCQDIIKYLRDNPIHDCNVVGVEMGNEPYFDYSSLMMNWDSFEDYWSYINGTNFTGPDTSKYKYVWGDSVWKNHDFIGKFKNQLAFTCPVGIPAQNLDAAEYALFSPGSAVENNRSIDEDWNAKLKAKYGSKETVTGYPAIKRYSFNAVILHPYYDGHNWDTIPKRHLDTAYACHLDDAITTNDDWLFNTYDTRLEETFDGIGGNFRKFIKVRYKESYDVHKETFAFDSTNVRSKDLWVTEWNFKDQGNYDPDTLNMIGIFSHGYMHGYIVFEWFLKDVKLNFDSEYRPGFHTLSTFHNIAGGGTNAMIYPAIGEELDALGKDIEPYNISPKTDTAARNYLMKMTPFFSFELLSQISKNNLKYLQTNYVIATKAVNVQPSVFIDPDQNYLYIYFSNIRDTVQKYNITTTGTVGVYPDGGRIQVVDTAVIYCIDALKPYSTSGKGNGTLYKLNHTYAITPGDTCDLPIPLEIRNIDTIINQPWDTTNALLKITVPAYSYGYIKLPIRSYGPLRLNENESIYDLEIFPNPASSFVKLVGSENNEFYDGNLQVKVLSITGNSCLEVNLENGHGLDISHLSAGVYQIIVKFDNSNYVIKKLIKQ